MNATPTQSANESSRVKIFLSAYACEPGKGSEPGVGWRWTRGLAHLVDLTVLTRANNQGPINQSISELSADDPLRYVRFLYHDLGPFLKLLKRHHLLPTLAYYFIWQWTASRRFRHEAKQSDIIHHLTFCTAMCPGFWDSGHTPLVIGPVAAPLVNTHYYKLFGLKAPVQALRNILIRNLHRFQWLRNTFYQASAVLPANSEAKELLESMGIPCQKVMLDTGAPTQQFVAARPDKPSNSSCRFLYAGVLERRKGLEITLRAFAKAIQSNMQETRAPLSLTLLGNGPDRARLEALADALGLSKHVHFAGKVPQPEVARYFAESDAFVFTSVRDTSGGVNLEAMASGLPILCLAHQGVGDITDDSCAMRIEPGPIPETIKALADSMLRLVENPDLRGQLGTNARRRALDKFTWQEKFERMVEIYEAIGRG